MWNAKEALHQVTPWPSTSPASWLSGVIRDSVATLLIIPQEVAEWIWELIWGLKRFLMALKDKHISDKELMDFLRENLKWLMDESRLHGGETIVNGLETTDVKPTELLNCFISRNGELIFTIPKTWWWPIILAKTDAELRKITIILKLLQEWYKWGTLQNGQIHPKNIILQSGDLSETSLKFLEENYGVKRDKQGGIITLQI